MLVPSSSRPRHVPIGIPRPLTDATLFDGWYFALGEYTSKVAYHFSGGSLPWGRAEDAWDPVTLYRKVLAEVDDGSVTIVSIGFLDNLSALLNSSADAHSPLPGRDLLTRKLAELVVMGGSYLPSSSSSSSSSAAAAAANDTATLPARTRRGPRTWSTTTPVAAAAAAAAADEAMTAGKKRADPVGMAYVWYGYGTRRPSWDPLAAVYAIRGLVEFRNAWGRN
ncbi:uncharacterized protein P884DRAFT_297375 [Thermothelomyces heterothallicus CBS 202.75]|uniref:uncharacterized protein n=1 Tax=Thermothelomyces heterothallicus CBS 202.75 TaxID=1149848 RepID=UPI0037424A7A